MAFIARAQQYRSKRSVPSQIGVTAAPGAGDTAKNQALNRLGDLLAQRGAEMQKEEDIAKAIAGYNEFLDLSRDKMGEFLSRQGENAYGLNDQYEEWFSKTTQQMIGSRFTTGTQQELFKEQVARERNRDLDVLSHHTATEHRKFVNSSLDGLFANTVKNISKNVADDANNEIEIANYKNAVKALNKGIDVTAKLTSDVQKIRQLTLEKMVVDSPGSVDEYIEKYKDEIGNENIGKYQSDAKAEIKSQTIDAVQAELQNKYEENGIPDFVKMRQDLTHDKDIPPDVKFEVRQWIDAYQVQYDSIDSSQKKQYHDEEERVLGMAFLDGKYPLVRNLLRKSKYLSGDEIKTWTNAINKARDQKIPIDPIKNSAAIVEINHMISQSWPQEEIKRHIVTSPYLTKEDKEQYVNKLETKLTSSVESGRKQGYKIISDIIFPKLGGFAGTMEKMTQSPQQVVAIVRAQGELDDWINYQLQSKKYPSIKEIKDKALEFGQANIVSMADRQQFLEEYGNQ